MKKLLEKKIYKKLIVVFLLIYSVCIFINQQKTLNSYTNQELDVILLMEKQEELKQELAQIRYNVNSTEYIEQVAREKLDMYLPNERVYIDRSK